MTPQAFGKRHASLLLGQWAPTFVPADPLAGSAWSSAQTVEGFARGQPNEVLLRYATDEHARRGGGVLLDIGCGAGRNAVPLAESGWRVLGTDLSWPMLIAAHSRSVTHGRLDVALAPMEQLPVRSQSVDVIVAHGIWNLARSSQQFRRAVREAARVAKRDAALFVFTFSRNTFGEDVQPVSGEPFVFTQFSGDPQCFLTEAQLVDELSSAGFTQQPGTEIREYNRRTPGLLAAGTAPVIYEGLFRRTLTPV